MVFTSCVSGRGNIFGSVCLSVCLNPRGVVGFSAVGQSCWARLEGLAGRSKIIGQGHRVKVKVVGGSFSPVHLAGGVTHEGFHLENSFDSRVYVSVHCKKLTTNMQIMSICVMQRIWTITLILYTARMSTGFIMDFIDDMAVEFWSAMNRQIKHCKPC